MHVFCPWGWVVWVSCDSHWAWFMSLANHLRLLVGAPLSGRISDRIVVYYRKKRGIWYPEDRLRVTIPAALTLVPLSVLISALLTEYVPGTLGLTLNLICLFLSGFGVFFQFPPVSLFFFDLSFLDGYCASSNCCLSSWPNAFQKRWNAGCTPVSRPFFFFMVILYR